MKLWIRVLKVLGYVWLVVAGLAIVAGIVGVWMNEGFSGVQEILSPFNVISWIITVLILAPGVGALTWARKLQEKERPGT